MEDSLDAFASFRDSLKKVVQHSNGDETFLAKVIYNYGGNTEEEILGITLSLTTMEYGTIRINDGEAITIDTVHTQFFPKFQKYHLTDKGFLEIVGKKSPKIGDYLVTIIPL